MLLGSYNSLFDKNMKKKIRGCFIKYLYERVDITPSEKKKKMILQTIKYNVSEINGYDESIFFYVW